MDRSKIDILVVDDERALASGMREALEREGYSVEAVFDGASAIERCKVKLFNLVISDVKMPGISGQALLARVKEISSDTLVILMTAYGTVDAAVGAMKHGAHDYLTKPVDVKRIRSLVERALEFQAVVAENTELRLRLKKRSEPSPLVGVSGPMRDVERIIDEVAASDITVLIGGESGTGKEIAATAIHLRSLRREQPFITLNCAALPENLLEAELFGHAKGAFTGAVAERKGRFQMAHKGTLFLDEIGDLSAKGQADLLRVLEDGLFCMVGGTETIHVDVRVVAATNKNLENAVKEGAFREDLFYRLQVVPIVMPPLRERGEDVPLLLESFLAHFAAKHKRAAKRLSVEAMEICVRYPWPGNVRQLRNTVERMMLTCHNAVIAPESLPDFLRDLDQTAETFTVRPGMSLADVEKLLIRKTLAHVTSNREKAAETLGISRRTLQYKLKEYGID